MLSMVIKIAYSVLFSIAALTTLVLLVWVASTGKVRSSRRAYANGDVKNKVFVRKCELRKVTDKKAVRAFFFKNHLAGIFVVLFLMFNFERQTVYGLYYQDELIYVCGFKKYKRGDAWQCYAMCSKINTLVTGAVSKILKTFITASPSAAVRTWTMRSGGAVYEQCGFKLVKQAGFFKLWALEPQAEFS